jgi:hypothetical protein
VDETSAIASRMAAFPVLIDARRWDDLVALFTPQVVSDYTDLFGGAPEATTREALVGGWRKVTPGFSRTTHLVGAPHVTVDGRAAKALASMTAWHFIDDAALAGRDVWTLHGCYEMGFEKGEDGVWRIAALTLARTWAEGNGELMRLARARVKAAGAG